MENNLYIEKAVNFLQTMGVKFPSTDEAPVLKLLDKLQDLEPNKIMHIGKVLQQSSNFNEVIRNEIKGMEVANRYDLITGNFTSVRNDLNNMVSWMEDGKLDFGEKIQKKWMEIRRGSLSDRFEDIRQIYLDVCKDTNDQIEREHNIIEAYKDFRFALKQAQIDAQSCMEIASERLDQKRQVLNEKNTYLEGLDTKDSTKSKFELERDVAVRELSDTDKQFQIIKDIADNLKISYNTSEVVFSRIDQIKGVKERIYQQSIAFFVTNETTYTALAVAFESSAGLAESTRTLNAKKDVMNESIEMLAKMGNTQLTESLKAGYGKTIKASSVKVLADAIYSFQESSVNLIKELREESTKNANELELAVNDSKNRFSKLVSQGV